MAENQNELVPTPSDLATSAEVKENIANLMTILRKYIVTVREHMELTEANKTEIDHIWSAMQLATGNFNYRGGKNFDTATPTDEELTAFVESLDDATEKPLAKNDVVLNTYDDHEWWYNGDIWINTGAINNNLSIRELQEMFTALSNSMAELTNLIAADEGLKAGLEAITPLIKTVMESYYLEVTRKKLYSEPNTFIYEVTAAAAIPKGTFVTWDGKVAGGTNLQPIGVAIADAASGATMKVCTFGKTQALVTTTSYAIKVGATISIDATGIIVASQGAQTYYKPMGILLDAVEVNKTKVLSNIMLL